MDNQAFTLDSIPLCPVWRDIPPGVARAIHLVDTPQRARSEDLAQAIEETPALAELVLRHMNSPLYAPSAPVTDIKSAVAHLGYEVIRNFLASYMTRFILEGSSGDRPAFNHKEYWRHALSTCIAAELLGAKTGFEDPFRLFTYGLIHDIGFVVLERCFPARLDAMYAKLATGVPLLVAEKAVLSGLTHADVGAWLCRRWHLDETAQAVVLFHHTPLLAQNPCPELLLLYLGNVIGTRVYESRLRLSLGDSPADGRVLARLGLSPADVAQVDAAIDEKLAVFEKQYFF